MVEQQPLQVVVTSIDFSQTALAGTYNPFYAKVIDNLFTPEECAHLLDVASSKDGWKPAELSTSTKYAVHTDFRHNDSIYLVDESQAAWVYEKLRPYVEEIHEISSEGRWSCITNRPGKKPNLTPTWSLTGYAAIDISFLCCRLINYISVHPRLSFLRYGPGNYFKPHCDGLSEFNGAKSFVTFHLYLNDSAQASTPIMVPSTASSPPPPSKSSISVSLHQLSVSSNTSLGSKSEPSSAAGVSDVTLHGGSTRFWTPNKKAFLDVHPKMGRVLIFQQRMLVHSGEEVTQGIKYTMRGDFMFTEKA
ncbi:hypothetical protein H0H87_002656 [Tephrocybe sp. NHM501043]|nr:hypothetical protein H0H87_002656 [Tephrocybe sp. NHM501043]